MRSGFRGGSSEPSNLNLFYRVLGNLLQDSFYLPHRFHLIFFRTRDTRWGNKQTFWRIQNVFHPAFFRYFHRPRFNNFYFGGLGCVGSRGCFYGASGAVRFEVDLVVEGDFFLSWSVACRNVACQLLVVVIVAGFGRWKIFRRPEWCGATMQWIFLKAWNTPKLH